MQRSGTLVYDADCGFCTAAALWLARGGTHAVPWQGLPDVAAAGLDRSAVQRAAWWLVDGQARVGGAAAIAAALRARGPTTAALGCSLQLPGVRALAAAGYDVVAAHRHRLPGGSAACTVPRVPAGQATEL